MISTKFLYMVLIETYWNVKNNFERISDIELGINRNILECKEKRRGVCVTHTGGINRNILECKVRLREIVSTRRSGINRNILECKDYPADYLLLIYFGINRNILECKGLSPPAVRHTAVRY